MKKSNAKIIISGYSMSIVLIFILFFIYAKNNITASIPPKDTVEHLGVFSGVCNDYIDNSIYFTGTLEKDYTITPNPDSNPYAGPIQVYKLTSKSIPKNNNTIIGYFQRDNTTDIDIEIKSLYPLDATTHQAKWFLEDF